MTNEQQKTKELAKLLDAYAEEKQLQIKCVDIWIDHSFENIDKLIIYFNDPDMIIRVKPATKRVPLTMQDLIDRIKEGKTMWIALTGGGICQQITSFSWEYFTTNVGTYNYDQLAENFTFLDGTPCYKEVEDE